jgi:hypothetical protein
MHSVLLTLPVAYLYIPDLEGPTIKPHLATLNPLLIQPFWGFSSFSVCAITLSFVLDYGYVQPGLWDLEK